LWTAIDHADRRSLVHRGASRTSNRTVILREHGANLAAEYRARANEASLLKRAADKDDIAKQVVALCETDSITGQTLVIDSGRFFH